MTWKEWGLWVGVFVAAGICVLVLRHRRNEKSDPYDVTPNGGNVKGSTNTIWIAMATVAVLRRRKSFAGSSPTSSANQILYDNGLKVIPAK